MDTPFVRPFRAPTRGGHFLCPHGESYREGGEGVEKQEMIAKIVAALEESDAELVKLVLLFVSILKK